jgi:hypothetical protein
MKLRTALAAALMVSTVVTALAQEKGMQAKPMMKMKAAPMKPMKTMSKAEWQGMYDKAAMAFSHKDADGIFRYMTPDFSMTMMGQNMNTAQAKASMKQWFGMMKDLHCKFMLTSVKNNGSMVTVMDKFNMWGTMMDPKTKKPAKYTDMGSETATWVRMNGHWMMKKLVSKDEKMTLNGKPFDPTKMGG